MKTRTIVIIAVAAVVLALAAYFFFAQPAAQPAPPAAPTPDYWPTDEWRTTTPEEQGLDSAALAEHLLKLRDDGAGIDSLLIIRDGYIVVDAYFAPYDGTFSHDVASVTKSFTTTLIGIAAEQGLVDLDAPVLSFFQDRTIANVDERKQAMTVRDLAGMVNGFQSGCLGGDATTLNEMRAAPDWVQHSLDRVMVLYPGEAWCYDSPGMHILSAILTEATGMTESEFARANLFEPLGITDFIWETDPQGYTHGWGDLHLRPRDAAKLGLLFLNGGAWNGQQIVSAEWVREASAARVPAGDDDSYGYGWWVGDGDYWAAGRGGQFVRVVPLFNAVIVVTASDLEFDQLDPLIAASAVSPTEALPANPEGTAALEAALADLITPATDFPVTPLSPLADTIGGRRYVFGEDAKQSIELLALTLQFDSPTEAVMLVEMPYREAAWPVGLDGVYRQAADGRAMRGYWSDEQTLVFEMFDVGALTYSARFDGDRLILTADGFPGEFVGVAEAE